MHWADDLFGKAKLRGILCSVARRVNGWPETMVLNGNTYYVKSMSYNADRNLYFQGVTRGSFPSKEITFYCVVVLIMNWLIFLSSHGKSFSGL